MNENLELLAKTLEGDEYQQTTGVLYHASLPKEGQDNPRPLGYCCLGVACDVFAKATGEGDWSEPDGYGDSTFHLAEGESDSSLIGLRPVQEFFNLSTDEYELMIGYNDSYKQTFKQIASLIRRGFPDIGAELEQ